MYINSKAILPCVSVSIFLCNLYIVVVSAGSGSEGEHLESLILVCLRDNFQRQSLWRQGFTEIANWLRYGYSYLERFRKKLCTMRPFTRL